MLVFACSKGSSPKTSKNKPISQTTKKQTEKNTAKHLYENYADMSKIPVIDYHCHINPREIYEDRQFENITQVWLGGDHYKWRFMRSCGVEEKYITGDASDEEKRNSRYEKK